MSTPPKLLAGLVAFQRLGALLDEYIVGCGDSGEPAIPILQSHPLHQAICAVKQLLPHNRLPEDIRFAWQRLVVDSRKPSADAVDMSPLARQVRDWANGKLEGWTYKRIMGELHIGRDTLRKLVIQSGIEPTRVGQRGRRFTIEEMKELKEAHVKVHADMARLWDAAIKKAIAENGLNA